MAGNNFFSITMKVKKISFDRLAVKRSVAPGKKWALQKIGKFVRTKARSSIGQVAKDKNIKPRPAGKPPRTRTSKKPNLKSIWWELDSAGESVVIGPIKFNQVIVRDGANPIGGITVPQVHEFGGDVRMTMIWRRWKGKWQWLPFMMFRRRSSRHLGPGEKKKTVVKKYPPRPFMGPAFQHELKNDKLIGAFEAIQGTGSIGPVAA